MDREVVDRIREANELSMTLMTLLLAEESDMAVAEVLGDERMTNATTLACASLAASAIRTLAQLIDSEPLEVLRVAALSGAQMSIELERRANEEE